VLVTLALLTERVSVVVAVAVQLFVNVLSAQKPTSHFSVSTQQLVLRRVRSRVKVNKVIRRGSCEISAHYSIVAVVIHVDLVNVPAIVGHCLLIKSLFVSL
jgi:hypothetical protein